MEWFYLLLSFGKEHFMRRELYNEIQAYSPKTEQEEQDKKVMLKYIETFDDILTRENEFAHMTASPWIVNEDYTKVLMIYHRIYDSWGWCGGHSDGESDQLFVALKEGAEETGLTSIRPLSEQIIAIDILPVPSHKKRGAFIGSHVHLNVTYLCVADEREELHHNEEENKGALWVPIEEVCKKVSQWDRDMIPVYQKLNERLKEMREKKHME